MKEKKFKNQIRKRQTTARIRIRAMQPQKIPKKHLKNPNQNQTIQNRKIRILAQNQNLKQHLNQNQNPNPKEIN